jgi:hypothetical protein
MAGLARVLSNLNKEIKKLNADGLKGVKKASIFLQGEAMEITPQRKGVLVNSAFHDAEMTSKGPIGRVGYTANYASFVHEMPETNNFTKPDTGPKFLEKAAKENGDILFNIIRKEMQIK